MQQYLQANNVSTGSTQFPVFNVGNNAAQNFQNVAQNSARKGLAGKAKQIINADYSVNVAQS